MSFSQAGKPAALVTLGTASASGSNSRILLLADENGASTTALANGIADAGFLVTVRPAPEYEWNGTNPSLDGFDLVIHLNGNTFFDQQALSPAAQSALVAFVQGGGGFIGSQWNGYEANAEFEATGARANMQDLVLAGFPGEVEDNCGSCDVTYTAVLGQESHPVLAGLPSPLTFRADGHAGGPQLDESSTVLMRLPQLPQQLEIGAPGAPGVLVRSLGEGKVVNFNFAPNYGLGGEFGETLKEPDIQRLYVNAVKWAARVSTEPPAKAPATITLSDPAPTFDGTVKAASIATNPVGLAGLSVTYSQAGVSVPEPVSAGTYQVLVTLDHADFEAPQATGTLTIRKATPVINWTPPTIVAGTALTDAALNASATGVDGNGLLGEFVYLPAAGTALAAGTHQLSVEFLPFNGNYRSVIKTITVAVSQPAGGLTFKGFYPPVRNLPVRNRMKAGRSVTVKFSVSGNHGLGALQSGSPTSRKVDCVAGAPERTVDQTSDARRSRLEFSRRRGQYSYVWKTSSDWAETCRMFEVKLVDGTTHEALFRFVKKSSGHRDRGRDDDRDRNGGRNDDD
jgi:hypothetical protein